MSYKLRMENGAVIEVPDDVEPEDAIDQYVDMVNKEHGYNPDQERKPLEHYQREVDEQWAEDNPIRSRVASFQAGARNLGRNLGQMALPKSLEGKVGFSKFAQDAFGFDEGGFTDEDLERATEREAPLKEAHPGYHTAGEIVPTFAGGIGTRIPGMGAAMANFPKTAAAIEGGTLGAAVAGPQDRTRGAVMGAAGGLGGVALGGLLGRPARGLAPASPAANRAKQMASDIPNSEELFIPVGKAAPQTGKGAGWRYLYEEFLPNFPSASRILGGQIDEASQGTVRNLVRQAYGRNADDVLAKWTETGRLDDALKYGDELAPKGKAGNFTKSAREMLGRASRKQTKGVGNRPLQRIARMAPEELSKTTKAMRDLADEMDDLLTSKVPGEQTLAKRATFYRLVQFVGMLPGMGAASRVMAKPGFQNFVMGNTFWQKPIQNALAKGDINGLTNVMNRAVRNYFAESMEENTELDIEGLEAAAKEFLSE